jgi:hypothetical protein
MAGPARQCSAIEEFELMTANVNTVASSRLRTAPRFDRLRPRLRCGPTDQQIEHVQELLRLHPRAPAAFPVCPNGVLSEELLRSWHRSAVAWLIYEIESAPYNR